MEERFPTSERAARKDSSEASSRTTEERSAEWDAEKEPLSALMSARSPELREVRFGRRSWESAEACTGVAGR